MRDLPKLTPVERVLLENQKTMFHVLRVMAWALKQDAAAMAAQGRMCELHDILNQDSMRR